jgi:hypothetical protein
MAAMAMAAATTTLAAAIEINLDAIDWIQTGLEREAIELLDSTWLTLNLQQLPDGLIDADATGMTGPPFTLQSVATDDFMSASPYPNREWSIAAEPEQSCFTIFNRAFQFQVKAQESLTSRSIWCTCAANLPIAMLYNEGLAYHILACRTLRRRCSITIMPLVIWHIYQTIINTTRSSTFFSWRC